MAGNKRPSFLKRQKEQKRMARAAEKREARRLKKRGGGTEIEETGESDAAVKDLERTDEAAPNDPADTV